VRTLLKVFLLLMLLWFVARNPAAAAHMARSLGHGLDTLASGFGSFAGKL